MNKQSRTGRFRVILQLVILAALAGLALNYQWLLDQYALHTFQPGPQLAAIEKRLDLTPHARAVFYRAKPQIDSKTAFNHDCNTQPHELELGCFYNGRIYILQIDNASLASEMDVVTAHELLHALWVGLSVTQRKNLGAELGGVYQQQKDEELTARMASYAQTEPGETDNELHSILGTEITVLPLDLDQYYAKYFSDRSRITAAHAAYEAVFNTQRVNLESQLAQIRALKGQLGVLNAQMEAYRRAGQITSYNALVPRQNALVDDINSRIATYRTGVDEYNTLSKSLESQPLDASEAPAQ